MFEIIKKIIFNWSGLFSCAFKVCTNKNDSFLRKVTKSNKKFNLHPVNISIRP